MIGPAGHDAPAGLAAAPPSSPFEHRHFSSLDGIRGILALSVVFLHFGINSFLHRAFGYDGIVFQLSVDVFFLLSGFVLTASVSGRTAIDVPRFVGKRILRLLPVYYVTLAAALVFAPPGYDYGNVPAELALSLPLLGHEPVNFPGWSITWEFFIPVAAAAAAPWIARLARFRFVILVVTLVALGTADVAVAGGGRLYAVRAACGLVAGCCLYGERARLTRWSSPGASYLLMAAILAVMAAASVVHGVAAAVPVLASMLILAASRHQTRLFSSRPCQLLGTISYTLYLVHVPVLLAMQSIFGDAIGANPAAKLGGIGTAIILAAALTLTVERPAMRLSKSIFGARAS